MGGLMIWGITHYFPRDPELDVSQTQSFGHEASSRDRSVGLPGKAKGGRAGRDGCRRRGPSARARLRAARTTTPGVPRAAPARRLPGSPEDADAGARNEDGGRGGGAAGGRGRPRGGRLEQVGAAQRGGHGVPDHPADAVPGAEVLPQPPVPGGGAAVGPGEAPGWAAWAGVPSSLGSGPSGLAPPPAGNRAGFISEEPEAGRTGWRRGGGSGSEGEECSHCLGNGTTPGNGHLELTRAALGSHPRSWGLGAGSPPPLGLWGQTDA